MILDKINSKDTIENLQAFLTDQSIFNSTNEQIKEIFFEAVLKKSMRSVEHVKRLCEHFSTILQGFYHHQPESQVTALTLIAQVWRKNPTRAIQIIERLTDIKLFENINIITFIFKQISTCSTNDLTIEFKLLKTMTDKICNLEEILK